MFIYSYALVDGVTLKMRGLGFLHKSCYSFDFGQKCLFEKPNPRVFRHLGSKRAFGWSGAGVGCAMYSFGCG